VSLKDSYTVGVRRAVVPLAGRLVTGGRVTPNGLTVGGLVLNVATVPLILSGHFIWAAVVLLLAGVCDMLDGAVARISEQVTPFGAFLDSTSDRLSEGVVLMAIGVWFARNGHTWDLAAVFVALMMSFLVSYTRARAEALGLECKVGLASRPERVVLLMVGLLFARYHVLSIMVWAIAILTTYTVVQRILHVRRQLADSGGGATA
jgi:CDP-diacylglycerol---glycerol-3-phosphate 3-phosphatidyltransferase